MTKHLFRGAAAVALFSMLCAAMTPAPLFAASSNLGAQIEQTTNPGDDGQGDNSQDNNSQDDNSQNGQSNQTGQNNQNQQGQNQQQNQGQSGQGQQQGNNQGACFASTDQANANFPTGCTTTLGPGARQWYQFRYQGLSADRNDEDNASSDSSSQPPTVDARLQMDTPGCISFEVTTQAHLQNPDPDDDGINEPIGAGTPVVVQNNNSSDDSGNDSSDDSSDDNSSNNNNDNNNNNDRDDSVLGWQGSANANITFYIIVRNTRDFSCTYNLSLTGAGVPVPGQQPGQQGQQQDQFGQQDQSQQQGQQDQQGDQNNSGQDNNGQDNSDQNSQNDGQNNNDQNNGGTNG